MCSRGARGRLKMILKTNFPRFSKSIQKDFDRWDGDKKTLIETVAIQALADLQELSPVDTGTFRASHNLSVGTQDTDTTTRKKGKHTKSKGDEDKASFNKALRQLRDKEIKHGTSIFITNNLVYAQAIEHGHSKQAPRGVYRLAEIRALKNIRSEVSKKT